ncbi:type II secretion system protein, partial [Candidatus Saccharibacteria bacterium]|nr:type II secretion system protein [Candidatus Saccharibacteria bacterium]
MVKQNINNKKGFTIIEVVLVLAIAGLIFLMVFIALPALQRSQRNTQRRDDYSMLSTAVTNYMSNNGGRLSKILGSSTTGPTYLDPARWINEEGS